MLVAGFYSIAFRPPSNQLFLMDILALCQRDHTYSTGSSRNALKRHFRNLSERNHLERHGSGRGVWYGLKWPGSSERLIEWSVRFGFGK
jgi:hypothetical protein